MSQLPDPLSLNDLVDLFERIKGEQADPEEAAHRRDGERLVRRLAGLAVVAVLGVGGWVAVDPLDRYSAEQRQLGLQGLGSSAAALVGAVAGYLARGKR